MANGESATSTTRVRDNAATPDCAPPQSQDPVNRGAGSVLLSTGEVRFRRLAAATDKAQKTLDGSCFDIQSVHDFETHVRTMMDDTSTTVLPALVGQSSDSSDDFSDDFGLPRPPPEPPPSRRPRRRWERRHSSGRLRSVCSPQPVPSSRPRRHVGESAASRGDVGLAEGHGAELRSHGGCSEEDDDGFCEPRRLLAPAGADYFAFCLHGAAVVVQKVWRGCRARLRRMACRQEVSAQKQLALGLLLMQQRRRRWIWAASSSAAASSAALGGMADAALAWMKAEEAAAGVARVLRTGDRVIVQALAGEQAKFNGLVGEVEGSAWPNTYRLFEVRLDDNPIAGERLMLTLSPANAVLDEREAALEKEGPQPLTFEMPTKELLGRMGERRRWRHWQAFARQSLALAVTEQQAARKLVVAGGAGAAAVAARAAHFAVAGCFVELAAVDLELQTVVRRQESALTVGHFGRHVREHGFLSVIRRCGAYLADRALAESVMNVQHGGTGYIRKFATRVARKRPYLIERAAFSSALVARAAATSAALAGTRACAVGCWVRAAIICSSGDVYPQCVAQYASRVAAKAAQFAFRQSQLCCGSVSAARDRARKETQQLETAQNFLAAQRRAAAAEKEGLQRLRIGLLLMQQRRRQQAQEWSAVASALLAASYCAAAAALTAVAAGHRSEQIYRHIALLQWEQVYGRQSGSLFGGAGHRMMCRMGWHVGEGLGRNGQGRQGPVALQSWDGRGLSVSGGTSNATWVAAVRTYLAVEAQSGCLSTTWGGTFCRSYAQRAAAGAARAAMQAALAGGDCVLLALGYTMQAAALMAGQAAMLASSAALVCCTSAGWAVASARRLSGFDGCRRRRRRSRPLFIELQGYDSFSLRHQVQGYSRGAQGADRAAAQLDLVCSGFQWRQQLGAGGTCIRNRGWWSPLDASSEVENLSKRQKRQGVELLVLCSLPAG